MANSLKPLDQQVVVVTGASSGIGLATALAAADRGAKVALVARSTHALDEIRQVIESHGGEAFVCAADVGQRETVMRAAAMAEKHFGRIDTWINNAGVAIYGRVHESSDEDNRRLFDTNYWGVVYGSLAALPALERAGGGAIINVGSEVSDAVVPLQGMYSASKHAVKGFTDALRIELADMGSPISVTLVQPTAVDTPYPEHARSYLDVEPKLPTPMIDPERVADAILDAAVKPTQYAKVGLMAHIDSFTSRLAPRIASLMARMQVSRQQRDEAPQDPMGALHRPSEMTPGGAMRMHGRGNENAASGSAKRAIADADRQRARATEHATARKDGEYPDRPSPSHKER